MLKVKATVLAVVSFERKFRPKALFIKNYEYIECRWELIYISGFTFLQLNQDFFGE